MAKELLASQQKKGKEIISSIPCQVHDDFWGSHSPVFCSIMTLSIHIALISQELQVHHKHLISSLHLGVPGGREEARTAFDSFSSCWVVVCWDHYSFERDGGWLAKGLPPQAYGFMVLSLYWLRAGGPDNYCYGMILVHHSFGSFQCGANTIGLGKLRSTG